MNNFGLGLILSFTDNATAGLSRATGAFNNLNSATANFSQANNAEQALLQVSMAAGVVGNELYQVGEGITSIFTSAIQSITNTGSQILNAKTQLGTLYGSMEAGAAKLEEIKEYAATSIFNFEDLIPSVIMLKANGIEAFDKIASSAYLAGDATSKANQTLMDYAGDLAAFNPQMRNAYGTGIQAAMGALNEYISEGNALSLKRGASLDINQLLGEETGDTIEERSRQVADLIEQLGTVGITANLAGTPMQRLANIEDTLFNLTTEISNSGVYDKYSELIERITDYVFSIPDEEFSNIAQVIGGALTSLLDMLNPVLDMIIEFTDYVRELIKTNPELIQNIIKFTALGGILSLTTGIALKLMSTLGMLRFTLIMLFGGDLMTGGIKLLGLLKNLGLYVLPLIALGTLLKLAWERDFMGIQEKVKDTVKTVWDSVGLIVDAFTDNALSEENFQRAKELGILPLIEAILQLKYHWTFFVEGFKKGLDAFFETLSNVLTELGILDKDVSSFSELITALLDKITAPGMTDNWEKLGYVLGEISGWIMIIFAVLPAIVKTVKIILGVVRVISTMVRGVRAVINFLPQISAFFSSISGWITGTFIPALTSAWAWITGTAIPAIGSALSAVGHAILSGITTILGAIGGVVTAILGAFGIVVTLPAWLVGLITVAIVAIITLIVVFWDEIVDFFKMVGNAIANFFLNAWEAFNNLPWVQKVKQTMSNVAQSIGEAFNKVKEFFSPVIDIVKSVGEFIGNVFKGIGDIFVSLGKAIWSIIVTIAGVIKDAALGVWEVIKSIAGFIKSVFYVIYEAIRVVVLGIIWVFQKLFEIICAGLMYVHDFFAKIFGWINDNIITPVCDSIGKAFSWLYNDVIVPVVEKVGDAFNWLKENIITPACNAVKLALEGISKVVDSLCDKFNAVFTAIKTFICDAIQGAADFVNPIIESIGDAITWVADAISGIIDAASGALNWVGDKLKNAGDALSQAVGLSTGGYVKTTGIAVLHPNEVVVNDRITRELDSFLNDYSMAKMTSSPLINQDVVASDDYKEKSTNPVVSIEPQNNNMDTDNNSPMRSYVNTVTNYNTETAETNTKENVNNSADNRVIFESGSIVINAEKSELEDSELESLTEKLMKKMARKLQLRSLQTRS